MIKKYLTAILRTTKPGDATEPSYYGDLKNLFNDFLSSEGFAPHITVLPKKQIVGIPDFTVRKNKELIGYVEAKDPKYTNLGKLPKRDKEQIRRYIDKLPNLVLTNYVDFWLYREGRLIKKVRIASPGFFDDYHIRPIPRNEDQLIDLLRMFFAYYIPETRSPKILAKELAHRAHLLTQTIIEELENNEETEIDRIYNAFKEYLISDLTFDAFADIYAQTLTYGLFTARLNSPEKKFDRETAGEYIPRSIKIFRDTFNLITGDAIPESLESYIDDIATVLAHADIKGIKESLKNKSGDSDPLIHFYETFLAEYDPKKRKSLGVYYTPLPVVRYIVRSVNSLLKSRYGIGEGISGRDVTLLDPAAGTLTFIAESVKQSISEQNEFSDSLISLKDHFLTHFFAFEYQMAAYVIGHLRMTLLFEELGIPLTERFPLFLTNSLDFSEVRQSNMPFVSGLAQESEEAFKIKQKDILVIIGNPPYSSERKLKGELPEWIKEKLKDYSKGLGVENEKKKGVLQDDYIRFIRFAHWKISQYGKGIIALITNNSYLDGITHRSMRKQLMDSFDEIYILNLHGNSRIKEKTPEGKVDENVFDIKQGVSIALFVKTGNNKTSKVFYKDIWGLRNEKYEFLNKHTVIDSDLDLIVPSANDYYFVPKDYSLKQKYDSWNSIQEIFDKNMSGVETKRDDFVVDFEMKSLVKRISSFVKMNGDVDSIQKEFGLSSRSDLDVKQAQVKLKNVDIASKVIPYAYRIFDVRHLFYDSALVSRTRGMLMKNLSVENGLSLVTVRQLKSKIWRHAFIGQGAVDATYLANITSEWSYVFPLYTRNQISKQTNMFDNTSSRISNIDQTFKAVLENNMNSIDVSVDDLDVFYYVYAVLYSNIYRAKYNEFLVSDFPRIPFTREHDLFIKVCELGKRLVNSHLLKSKYLTNSKIRLHGKGSDRVETRDWKKDGIWINHDQFFGPISEEVWQYVIGGYQVADKWLKDRQQRLDPRLTKEEIRTFCLAMTSILETIALQGQIDGLFPEIERTALP